ncbi:MAG: hypothetical protein HQM08_24325 [Candidatus Riflebacteria bacterium]|nr:hypothetical protein [Candidatus Riflebacteria bacterium]
MSEELTFMVLPKQKEDSAYTWINISRNSTMIGKARVIPKNSTLVICSINIFPEFERRGYARATIDAFKKEYKVLIADRVRFTAVSFWVKMGFKDDGDGCYSFEK